MMMNKTDIEWLEDIKKAYSHDIGQNDFPVSLSFRQFNRLIEQTERAQELESLLKSHAPEGRNYTNAQYVETSQENKRFREALNWYADDENWWTYPTPAGHLSAVSVDKGSRARQAIK